MTEDRRKVAGMILRAWELHSAAALPPRLEGLYHYVVGVLKGIQEGNITSGQPQMLSFMLEVAEHVPFESSKTTIQSVVDGTDTNEDKAARLMMEHRVDRHHMFELLGASGLADPLANWGPSRRIQSP